MAEAAEGGGGFGAIERGGVNVDAEGAAADGWDAAGDAAGVSGEHRHEEAMSHAGVGAALGGFVFEFVEFGENLDRDDDVVVLEAVEAMGVV